MSVYFRFVTRVYWFSQLLNPRLLKPLPDNVVVIGLVVHVLLWILGAINLRQYWVRHSLQRARPRAFVQLDSTKPS